MLNHLLKASNGCCCAYIKLKVIASRILKKYVNYDCNRFLIMGPFSNDDFRQLLPFFAQNSFLIIIIKLA